MKRSNRLVLLVGVFLAIIAFIAVILLSQRTGDGAVDPNAPPTELPTVVATTDIPLGGIIREDQVEVQVKPIAGRDADAFGDESQVIGQVARQQVLAGAAITGRTLALGGGGSVAEIRVPAGQRAYSVRVDQETGVGTVIKPGDYVDVVVSLGEVSFPLVVPADADDDPATGAPTLLGGDLYIPTSTKILLQGIQVLGVLLPPADPQAQQQQPQPSAGTGGATTPGTTLSEGRTAIVILSLTAQEAEAIRWSQVGGRIALALRSPDDFVDDQGNPVPREDDPTTGVILRTLVDTYGVLPPEVIEAVEP